MKKFLLSAAAALCALVAMPSLADAAVRGFSTANVNMRSGPSTAYPAVTVIPVGARVTIHGCMSSVNWCDVAFSGGRGWVSGNYVQAAYQQRRVEVGPRYYQPLGIPTVTFEVGNYWDRHYRGRDFYRDRDRWDRDGRRGNWDGRRGDRDRDGRGDWDRRDRDRSDGSRDGRRGDWDGRRGDGDRDGRRGDWQPDQVRPAPSDQIRTRDSSGDDRNRDRTGMSGQDNTACRTGDERCQWRN